MRIGCFANHGKTEFFQAVGEVLRADGHEIFWIVPGHRLANWLRRSGASASMVLDLTSLAGVWTEHARRGSVGPLPRGPLPGDMTIRHMIAADRFLRERPRAEAEAYLGVCSAAIATFVQGHGIDVVIGEQTYALEILAAEVLGWQGVPFLAPASTRIPPDRFALFPAPAQARFGTSIPPSAPDHEAAEAFLAGFEARPTKPFNFDRNRHLPRPGADWVLSPAKQLQLGRIDPHEFNRPTLGWLLRSRVSQVSYARLTKAVPFRPAGELGSRPFVVYPLHRQPEASIDVMAFRIADQAATVESLARELPAGWLLVVKEHSHGLGDRSPRYLRRLARIPGVILVDPWADSVELARRAALTVVTTGTLAFEAGLLGLPAVTLIPMYFDPLLVGAGLSISRGELQSVLRGVANGSVSVPDRLVRTAFLASLMANSRPGLIGARDDTDGVMDPANIKSVAVGLSDLLAAARPAPRPSP